MTTDKRPTQKIWIFTGVDKERGVASFETRYHKVEGLNVREFDPCAYFNVISNGDGTASYPTQVAEATLEDLRAVSTWEDLVEQGCADNPHQPMLPASTKKQAMQILEMYGPKAAVANTISEPQQPRWAA